MQKLGKHVKKFFMASELRGGFAIVFLLVV